MKHLVILAGMLAAACSPKPPEFKVGFFDAGAKAESAGERAVIQAGAGPIRFESYSSVLNGAREIWYVRATSDPERLFRIDLAVREMRAMAPIFARGRPIPLPFEPPTKGWMARGWTYRGRDYLVLVNRTRDRQWKVPDAALEPTWRPLFEVRRDPRELLKKHMDAYYLKPYQVLVLESRIRPKRLLGR